jgi:hypothetical protein
MASSRQFEREPTSAANATLAKALAPEEIGIGDFVTPLFVIAEVPSYFWFADEWDLPRDQPVRMRFTPNGDGMPLKVKSICLPFVLVKDPLGRGSTLDLRKCQVARLDKAHARRAWKAYKKANSPPHAQNS